ncbi:class I SAM-dependent methyltransferase [Microbacterium sp. gxy059]|uniref:class I SAM-dependent methyltransferase n=1 Tax=Microbacterium sp. gxy059 TaxID=2957199 RepID=UPI003D99911A
MDEYGKHNTAFHPELVAAVSSRSCRVLDVGCGDGLLLQELRASTDHVTGVDPDRAALERARARFADPSEADIVLGDLLSAPEVDGRRFDLITWVAALHHLPLVPALERMRDLLAPGGQLRIVGLAANRSIADAVLSGVVLVPIRVMSRVRRESGYPGMATARPSESLAEIREAAAAILPGSRIRRRFSYRCRLTWIKPAGW